MTIELLWESAQAIAVEKPAGIATQAPQGIESLESMLRTQLRRQDSYLAFPHRLDRVVSGVVLVALTKKAARLLSGQFASRKTTKQYTAVVSGRCGDWKTAAGESPNDCWEDYLRKIPATSQAEPCDASAEGAKLARTLVLGATPLAEPDRTRLVLQPITGRMHQLRVQTAMRGCAIVGDRLYEPLAANCRPQTEPPVATPCPDRIWPDRILLHASRLEFHDPATGKRMWVESPCPF